MGIATGEFAVSDVDLYTLLPALWQAMTPAEKSLAVTIVQQHDENPWGIDCCRELTQQLKENLSDLKSLQPCIFLAIENPSHLSRGLVDNEGDERRTPLAAIQADKDTVA